MPVSLDDLRRYAVARTLFPPTTLERALERLRFVQADPIRAPARAQDLILRHRVKNYRAGDLESRYEKLGVEEDFFVNYGFMTRELQTLMHPRSDSGVPADCPQPWPAEREELARRLLSFVRARREAHPRDVDEHFAHGTVRNYWGGSSSATTHLLDAMHYRGMLRVTRREGGIRIYAAHRHKRVGGSASLRRERIDALADAAVGLYAPLPARSLSSLVRGLRFAIPQWRGELADALARARDRLATTRVGGVDWFWPAGDEPSRVRADERVRLLTPFDPIVHDRHRFELLWGWTYRFEAYTPAAKRRRGYYALPLLWRDRVIGWGNLAVESGKLEAKLGYVRTPPRDRAFRHGLAEELARLKAFLGLRA